MSGRASPNEARASFHVRLADGTRLPGPVVDLRGLTHPPARRTLVSAVRTGGPVPPGSPAVDAQTPGPAHVHVAVLTPETEIDRRAALADVAAARGVETDHDAALADARRALRDASPGAVDASELRTARRRAAEAGSETERLRERVATIRGRVTALRDAESTDATADALAAAEASLSETTRRLSEVATERVAAEQRLSLLEERARTARDRRAARLRLEDRVGNAKRALRAARVAAIRDDFAAARRRALDGLGYDSPTEPDDDAPDSGLADALAVVRLAPLRAPAVVAPAVVERLGGAEAAAESLSVPLVIR
ncbi:MAG: hypothetical protein ABEJ97_03105 [Halobellus sp.]